MNVQELLKLAGEARPALIEKTALAVRLTERIAPEFVADILADFQAIAENVDAKTKTANWREYAKGSGAAAAATVLAGLGLAVSTDLYNSARRGLTASRNWKRMIEANPQLREKELAEVRRHFNALHRVAPDLSADPLAAGAAVTRLMSSADPSLVTYDTVLTNAAKSQQDIAKAKYEINDFKGKLPDFHGKVQEKKPGSLRTNG